MALKLYTHSPPSEILRRLSTASVTDHRMSSEKRGPKDMHALCAINGQQRHAIR